MTTQHWDIYTGKLISSIKLSNIAKYSAISPCGDYELLNMEDSTTIFKDYNTHSNFNFIRNSPKSISTLKVSNDGRYLLSGSLDNKAILMDLIYFKKIHEYSFHSEEITCVAISPDNKYIITAALDKKVFVIDLESGKLIQEIIDQLDIVMSIAFSQSGNYLLLAGRDKIARLYWVDNIQNKVSLINKYVYHTDWITCVSFSDDEYYVLTGGRDNKAVLFDRLYGNHVVDYLGHTESLTEVAFTPNGKMIVTASIDGSVKVYDKLIGTLLHDLKGHHGPILSMAINNRGDESIKDYNNDEMKVNINNEFNISNFFNYNKNPVKEKIRYQNEYINIQKIIDDHQSSKNNKVNHENKKNIFELLNWWKFIKDNQNYNDKFISDIKDQIKKGAGEIIGSVIFENKQELNITKCLWYNVKNSNDIKIKREKQKSIFKSLWYNYYNN